MSKQQEKAVEDAAEEEKESAEDFDGDDVADEQLNDTAEDSDGEHTGTGSANKSPRGGILATRLGRLEGASNVVVVVAV